MRTNIFVKKKGRKEEKNGFLHNEQLVGESVVISFIFSKNWPFWPILFISRNVHVSLCLSATLCIHGLNVFVPPLPKVPWQNFLDIQNPWGKGLEKSGIRFENFTHKGCKIDAHFFSFFFFRRIIKLIIKSIKSRFFRYRC